MIQAVEEHQTELQELDDQLNKSDYWLVYLMIGICLVCLSVVLPYRSIHLPRLALFGIGLALSMFLVPFVLERYEIIVLLFLTYMPFNRVVPGTFGRVMRTFNATNIFLGLSIIAYVVYSMMRHRKLYHRSKMDVALCFFMFFAALSFLRGFLLIEGRNPADVLFALKRWLTPLFVMLFVTIMMRTLRQGLLLYISVSLSTTLVSFYALKKFFIDHGVRSSIDKMRIEITSGPNHLGYLMCSCVFLLVALWWIYKRNWKAWLLLIPIVTCFQAMRITFSRGAQVGFVAGLFCFCWYASKKLFLVLCLVTIYFFIVPEHFPSNLKGRLGHTLQPGEGPLSERLDKSSSGRLIIWRGGVKIAVSNPIFGIGYRNFRRVIGAFEPEMRRRDAHNTYVIVAAEMGLIAFFFFILLFWKGFMAARFVYRHTKEEPHLQAIALGYLSMFAAAMIANFFGSRFDSAEVSVQIYALTGVVVCCEKVIRLRQEEAGHG